MTNDKNDNQKIAKEGEDTAAGRGKKAIEAGKVAQGENPSNPETKRKEEGDAENWRNEG